MFKKLHFQLVILNLLLLPALFLMIKQPIYYGYDVQVHIERIAQFHQAILEGQIPPRLSPTLIYGNTYPLFVVNYQLPYLMAEPFMFLFNNPALAYKSVMSITYILSIIFAFLFFKKFSSNIASFTGSVLFAYFPYRFANLYFRGSIGESVSLAFIPLVLIALHQVKENKKYATIFLALSVFGLITSHTAIFIIFSPLFAAYIFLLKMTRKQLFAIIYSFFLGVLSSSYQLLPAVFEKKYLKFDQTLDNLYTGQFVNFFTLFRIPHADTNLGTHLQVGIISFLLIFVSIIYAIFFKKKRKRIVIFTILAIASSFLATKGSKFFWDHSPVLKDIIYPWRFIALVNLSCTFLAVTIIDSIKSSKVKLLTCFFLILLTIYTSRHYFLKTGFDKPFKLIPTLTAYNESDPIWSQPETFMPGPLISSSEPITIKNLQASPFSITFDTDSGKKIDLTIRRMYFPGWIVAIDGKKNPSNTTNGFLATSVPPGAKKVEARFEETPIRALANIISLSTLLFILCMIVIKFKKIRFLKIDAI